MRKLLTLFTALLFVGSMWGETYTLGWGAASGTAGTYSNFTAVSGTVDGIVSFSTNQNSSSTPPAYNAKSSELRLYYHSEGDGGSVTLTPASGVTITGFVMTTSTAPSVNYFVDGGAATSVSESNNTYTVSGISVASSLKIQNANTSNTQLRIKTIQITYSAAAASACADPAFSPESQTFYGSSLSVELSCTTPGAAIHYTIDGSTPTSSSATYSSALSITATTTVKAIAVKDGLDDSEVVSATYTKGEPVEGYDIDFEANTTAPYINWTFNNVEFGTGTITAHGGTYYGTTGGKTTASITTSAKVAKPETFTCYVSKQSGNTTSSTWKIQVSSDGAEWTDAASRSATDMDPGSWVEFSVDLSTYKNVYVRLYYSGSTAVRNIDDISLTMLTPSVSVEPSPIAFGTVKQHSRGPLDTEYIFKSFTVTGANLDNNITVNAPSGSIFDLWDVAEESVIGSSINLIPDANGSVEKELAIMAATGWSGAQNGSFTIEGNDLDDDITINITMNVTPTFEVGVDVNDDEMGTATINGQSAVYTDGDDVLNIVATPKPGYEFVNWTVSDGEVLGVADATSATTTVNKATAAGTITANFQAQACTNLAAPALSSLSKDYEYANIAWTAVEHASQYKLIVTEHEGEPHIAGLVTSNLSSEILNLKANTQYDYSVMAMGDGSMYCDESNPLLEGSFTTDDYPAATLTLSENGVERAFAGSHKLKDVVTLPTETETGVAGKVLVGWSASEIEETDVKPAYNDKGAEYTMNATDVTLYAVYATETPGAVVDHDVFATTSLGSTNTVTDGYEVSAEASAQSGYYQDGSGDTRYVQVMVEETATQIIASEPSAITVNATIGGGSVKDPLGNNVYAQFLDASGNILGDPVVVTTKVEDKEGKEYVVDMPVANYANVRGVRISHEKETSYNVRYYAISLSYTTSTATTYSAYSTSGPSVPTAIDNTEVDAKAVKLLRNGILLIEKNDHTYNAMGQLVK